MATSITTTQQSSALQHFNPDQMKVLQEQLAPKCSPSELKYFIEVCKITGLSPFTREIYAISRNVWNADTKQKEPKMTIQVSIDGLRKRAANSGFYDGSITYWCGEDAQWREVWLSNELPSAAKTVVYRKGSSQPFTAVARFDAYKQGFDNKGKFELSAMWGKMADIMIGKCSEALALRKAFPEQTAGLYASEEMDQADNTSTFKEEPQPQLARWNESKWAKFQDMISRCDSIEKLEMAIQWVSKQSMASQEQGEIINSTLAEIGFKLNESKPVKSAQADDFGMTQEEMERESAEQPF